MAKKLTVVELRKMLTERLAKFGSGSKRPIAITGGDILPAQRSGLLASSSVNHSMWRELPTQPTTDVSTELSGKLLIPWMNLNRSRLGSPRTYPLPHRRPQKPHRRHPRRLGTSPQGSRSLGKMPAIQMIALIWVGSSASSCVSLTHLFSSFFFCQHVVLAMQIGPSCKASQRGYSVVPVLPKFA